MLLFGLASSLAMELLQLTTHLGMLDVDDLLNNTNGVGMLSTVFEERIKPGEC